MNEMSNVIFVYLFRFAHMEFHGILLPRLLAPVALVGILWYSRLATSLYVKMYSIAVALVLYFLSDIVDLFH